MTLKCEHCGFINPTEKYFCYSCKKLLFSEEKTIQRLIQTQERLERNHKHELDELRNKIKQVEFYLSTKSEQKVEQEPESPVVSPKQIKDIQKEVVDIPEPVAHTELAPKQKAVVDSVATSSTVNEHKPVNEVPLKPIKTEPSALSQFFEPMVDGLDVVKQIIARYKKEGKLPILLMTIAGILAILVGMGYLMQLTFDSLGVYSGLVKVGLGFVFSFGIGFIGKRLYKKDVKYEEYGSALLSLMLILNYLLIYFLTNLSDFPVLSSAKIGFLLIVANTGLSIFLAFRYETKIIAVLSLIGGALTPLYLNETGNPDFYFGYLWILLVASNFIAIHIKWYKLNYISFVLFLIVVEGAVFTDVSQSVLFTGYVHAFAYLFFYIVLFDRVKLKHELSKNDLLILCANLTVLLLNLYNTIEDYFWLGTIYLVNGIVFIGFLVRGWKTLPKQMKIGLFITIGSFVGLAIPFLFGQALMGLFWSIEAVLLIVLGFVYGMESIRKEGYVVLSVALFKLGMSALYVIEHWGTGLINEGFLNYIVLGLVFSSLWYIGYRFKSSFTFLETKLYSLFKEIIPIWLSSIFFIIGYDLLGYYSFNLMIISMFGLLVWHFKFKTSTTEVFALAHLFSFLIVYGYSANLVHSFSFSDQFWYGKLGVLEFLFSLWFLQFFYEKMGYKEQVEHKIVQAFRITFYVLLPLIFLKQVFKHANPYFPMAMWIGLMMSYGLYRWLKHYALLVETHLLLFIAVWINVGVFGINGMSLGIVTLSSLLILENAFNNERFSLSKFRTVLILIPYMIIGLIGYTVIELDMDFRFMILLVGILLSVFAYFRDRYDVIYKSYRIAIRLSITFGFIGGGILLFDKPSFFGVMLLMSFVSYLGYLLYICKADYIESNKRIGWGINVLFHQLLIILTYTTIIEVIDLDIDGPMMTIFLVIHAICILFVALKAQNKAMNKGSLVLFALALLKLVTNDIEDFTGTNKIIVLIVLGVLLLMASYGYVRVKNKYMPEEIFVDDNLEQED